MCQRTGTLGQSTPLLPEPLDGEEALHRARWDLLLWCQSQWEQVTFTSVPAPPQLTPFPQGTKTGEASLAQLPHKSASAPTVFHCPHGNHFTFCDCEFQLTTAMRRQTTTWNPRKGTQHSTLVLLHPYVTSHWFYTVEKNLEELNLPAELNSTCRPLKRSHSFCLPVMWTGRGN